MHRDIPLFLDACPFCGVASWSDYVSCVRSPSGDELNCRFCGACVLHGVIVSAGNCPDPDDTELAMRTQFPRVPVAHSGFVAPEFRLIKVSFAPAVPTRMPEVDR
jgi:hypothetical protein